MFHLLIKLEKRKEVWFLILISVIFFLLRLPSLFEPYWYGDEGIYEVIGVALRHGRLLYRDIWDNKPPLLYLLYALFNGDQTMLKFVSLLTGIIAIVFFFYVGNYLFKNYKLSYFLTSLFAILFGLPLLEGNIANAENFMLPLTLTAALLVIKFSHKVSTKKNDKSKSFLPLNSCFLMFFFAGLLLGIAFLFKVVAVFDFTAFVLFLLFLHYKNINQLPDQIVNILPMIVGFFIPFFITIVYFLSQHALYEFIHSAYLANYTYVNAGNKLLIPQGLLIIKLILLAAFCFFVFLKRMWFSSTQLFILLWLAFSIFNALFSQRSYTHYLLVFFASFFLFIGLFITTLFSRKTTYLKKLFYACLFFLITIFFIQNFQYYGKNIRYYINFFGFVTGKRTVEMYRAFFDWAAVRDYELADYITTHLKPQQQLFIWGDNAQLYKLTNTLPPGRYIVAYHIGISPQTYKETARVLEKTKPSMIVILQHKGLLPYSLQQYKKTIIIRDAVIYEHID